MPKATSTLSPLTSSYPACLVLLHSFMWASTRPLLLTQLTSPGLAAHWPKAAPCPLFKSPRPSFRKLSADAVGAAQKHSGSRLPDVYQEPFGKE